MESARLDLVTSVRKSMQHEPQLMATAASSVTVALHRFTHEASEVLGAVRPVVDELTVISDKTQGELVYVITP